MSACVTESSIFETTWLQRNPSGNQPFQQPKLLLGFLGVLHFRWCFDHVPKKMVSHSHIILTPKACCPLHLALNTMCSMRRPRRFLHPIPWQFSCVCMYVGDFGLFRIVNRGANIPTPNYTRI